MQQLDLFSPARLARRPYCMDDKESFMLIRSPEQALRAPYIQANAPTLQFRVVLDVDRPMRGVAVENWWRDDYGLPTPNWTALNPKNQHAHVAYEIEVPVAKHDHAHAAPIRFLGAIEDALARQLSADFGYSGLICKNPTHVRWETIVGRTTPYDMPELAEWLDLTPYSGKKPKRVPQGPIGRNCALFDRLRFWAYENLRPYKEAGNAEAWRHAVLAQAHEFNHYHGMELARTDPLAYSEVRNTARSVAKWVWQNFDLAKCDANFAALQAYRGAKGSAVSAANKRAKREEQIRNAIASLVQAGELPTLRAVARTIGCAVSTLSGSYGHLFEMTAQ